MSEGQHVGKLSDSRGGDVDEALEMARAQQAAIKAALKPIDRRPRGPRHEVGDGDRCPTVPEHGKMLVYGKRQYCPHSEHDGKVGEERTQCWFPLYMEQAVAS